MKAFWALASAVLVTGVVGAVPAKTAAGHCSAALPQAPAGLPASVVVTTNCGRFALQPGGDVVYEGAWTRPVPPVASSYSPEDLSWSGFSRGHILIGRGMEVLWRSQDRYRGTHPGNIGTIILGRRKLAFTYYTSFRRPPRLYLAGYRGAEHAVARDETPLLFTTPGGLIAERNRGSALVLRGGDGRFERRLVAHAPEAQPDRVAGKVVYVRDRMLVASDGVRVWEVGSLRRLGLTGWPAIEPLGHLVSVHDRRRLVVLNYSGHVFASTTLPRPPMSADGISSSLVLNAAGTAVAFTATSGNTAYGSRGRETVYELAAGETQAQPLYSQDIDFNVCERMAWLVWQGRWLLYADTEQHAAVVDASGAGGAVDLTAVIAALPGYRPDGDGIFDLAWG
jgi:hypothetical protein